MKTLIKTLIIVPLALVIILLSVANRAPVTLSFDPFFSALPLYALSAPLFVVILGAVVFGILLGGIIVWWSQRYYRRALRHQTYELERIKASLSQQNTTASFATSVYPVSRAKPLPARINAL